MINLFDIASQASKSIQGGVEAPQLERLRDLQAKMYQGKLNREQSRQEVIDSLQGLPPEKKISVLMGSGDPQLINAASNMVNATRSSGYASSFGKELADLQMAANSGLITQEQAQDRLNSLVSGGGRRPSSMEFKIREGMDTLGMDQKTATRYAMGYIRPVTDPITGTTKIVDITSGTEIDTMPQPNQESPLVQPEIAPDEVVEVEETLYEKADNIAGVSPSISEFVGKTVGQISPDVVNKKLIRDRQDAVLQQKSMVRLLQQNSRYPEGERKSIESEVSLGASFFDSPEAFRARVKSIESFLKDKLESAKKDANNSNLSTEMRKKALDDLNVIPRFLKKLSPSESTSTKKSMKSLPRDSVDTGRTYKGKKVYKTPDGKFLVEG